MTKIYRPLHHFSVPVYISLRSYDIALVYETLVTLQYHISRVDRVQQLSVVVSLIIGICLPLACQQCAFCCRDQALALYDLSHDAYTLIGYGRQCSAQE